ncbi:hypothetical protein P67b_00028 [Ruegeria phage Tedan]|nr:hypothetical protein P67b_00028 [Ruegeria phage Tedan]
MAQYTAEIIEADFKTVPYQHQLEELEHHGLDKARMLLWQMRTGKTKTIVDTACMLWHKGEIDAVVIVAPNGVHLNWPQRELPIHLWDTVKHDTLAWRTDIAGEAGGNGLGKEKRKGWEKRRANWWERAERVLKTDKLAWFFLASETMTRDDVRKLVQRIYRRKKKVLVVFDEIHDFRTPGSKRSQMARAMARKSKYRRGLTGTPLDNSPLHAWAQFQLMDEGCLGFQKYADFKDHHSIYVMETKRNGQKYPKLKEYRNLEELRDKMAPLSSVVLRSDCNDLPDLIQITRQVDLTEEQKQAYAELKRTFELELQGELVSVGENTQRMIKLQQVGSGFLKDEWSDLHELVPDEDNPRLAALVEEAEATTGKVIVWCAFHEDMDRAAKMFRARGHKIVEYHGRINEAGKQKARKALEPGAQNDVKALVGYPTPGLDLSAAEKIIWYSHTFDAIKRGQADERATAVGGQNVPVVDLIASPVDEYIVENVRNKVSVGDELTRDGMKEVLRRVTI